MSDALTSRLRDFTRLLLERRGAIVDWPADAEEGLAMLPPETAAPLACLEALPLSPSADSPLPINLASAFLERVEPLLALESRCAALAVASLYLKQADMAEPVAKAFTWLNARVRVVKAEPARTEYHAWHFRAVLDSADRFEDVLAVTINSASHAPVNMPDLLTWQHAELAAAEAPPDQPPRTLNAAARRVAALAEQRAERFTARLRSQQQRDAKRLTDYYHALLREDRKKTARAKPAEDDGAKAAKAAKARAVRLELDRKLAELDERYAARWSLTPLALVRLDCPVLAVHCDVTRRQARRTHTVYWNAVSKELEPLACRRCGAGVFAVAFSDDDVHAHCAACAEK